MDAFPYNPIPLKNNVSTPSVGVTQNVPTPHFLTLFRVKHRGKRIGFDIQTLERVLKACMDFQPEVGFYISGLISIRVLLIFPWEGKVI